MRAGAVLLIFGMFLISIFGYMILVAAFTPLINFTPPTPANATTTTNTSVEINISVTEADLDEFKWNWNGTNYTFYNDSLVLMMNFDNVSALGECTVRNQADCVIDVSKYGNNGTLGNATAGTDPTWNATGKYGGAFEFDGTDDYINISYDDSLNITQAITLSAWIKSNIDSRYILARDPPADWLGINSSHLDDASHPGYFDHLLTEALNGNDYWRCDDDETHWFIVDLGETKNVQKVRGRSDQYGDPANVNIYVSNDKENWGAGVATGITTWKDTSEFVEIDTTGKEGRYVKVEIVATEDPFSYLAFGDDPPFTIFDVYEGKITVPYALNTKNGGEFLIMNNSTIYNVTASGDINDGNWHHISATYNGSTMSLYTDGALKATSTNYSGDLPTNDGALWIGANYSSVDSANFNGTIDEIRIWNTSLSADEIYEHYVSNLNKYDTDKWSFYINQSKNSTDSLDIGTYTYQGFAKDTSGNENSTEERTLTIKTDIVYPLINFIAPTPANGTSTTDISVEIKINITNADDLDEFKWNWNGTNYTFYNDSLVLMMNFDNVSALGENDTYVVDLSKYGNNGTVNGNPVMNLTGGKYHGAFEFDGAGDYVDVGTLDGFKSVSMWIRQGVRNQYDYYFSHFYFGIYASDSPFPGILTFYDGSSDLHTTINMDDYVGEWVNIIVVKEDDDDIIVYFNGIIVGQSTTAAVIDSRNVRLGSGSGAFHYFNGTIDEVRIWNRSLSVAEVYEHYVSNLNKYDTDKWEFYTNQSKNATDGLDDGAYTYQGFAKDTAGNVGESEERTVTVEELIGFYCIVRLGSCAGDEVNLFQMSSTSDAHASVDDSYSYRVCCGGISGLGKSCFGNYNIVMRLYDTSNSHAETKEANSGQYNIDVCLSSLGSVNCLSSDSSCPADYICVASISDWSNAHVGDCNAYSRKICCSTLWNVSLLEYPLVNFAVQYINMLISDSALLKVQVRNLQGSLDNITLNISEYDFAHFVDTGDVDLSPDKRVMRVGLNPYEEREVFVRVYSSSIDQFYLQLNATSSLTEYGGLCSGPNCMKGSDTVVITVGYPVEFPGINIWGILLLVMISLIVYLRAGMGKQIAI